MAKMGKEGFSNIVNFKANAEKIEKLEEENKKLEEEITNLKGELETTSSLEQLKKSLNFVDEKYVANQLAAEVVSKNDGLWYTSIVISAGSDDGVKKNSLVMNGDGLVGIVTEVSSSYSKAITLLDTTSSVSFKLSKNSKYKGIITKPITDKTTAGYGIKFPKQAFWNSFIATRDEYRNYNFDHDFKWRNEQNTTVLLEAKNPPSGSSSNANPSGNTANQNKGGNS